MAINLTAQATLFQDLNFSHSWPRNPESLIRSLYYELPSRELKGRGLN